MSKVTNFYAMFYYCSGLEYLNLSNFKTVNAVNMQRMFEECGKLTSLIVSNFNTLKVINMAHMFRKCKTLTSLDLSNFYTLQLENMNYMFDGNHNSQLLDLSNFDTSNVNMEATFADCYSLTYINLKNSVLNSEVVTTSIFESVSSDLAICINDEKWNNVFGGYDIDIIVIIQ